MAADQPPLTPTLDLPNGTPWLGWDPKAYTPAAIDKAKAKRARTTPTPTSGVRSTSAAKGAPGQNLGAGIGEITEVFVTGVNLRLPPTGG